MLFNKGFKCETCGPIQKAKSKTISKMKHNVCPECEKVVVEWVRPLNERAGRCYSCGSGAFTLKVENHDIIRICKNCESKFNVDRNLKLGDGKGKNGDE